MKIDSALSQAMLGIQRGLASARGHAEEIANAGNFSLVEPLLGLRQDKLQVQASAQVLKAADAMLGSLLDEKA